MDSEALVLQLDGFEGPLDLLLELARAQKVDLAKISILALVEQFLAVIEGARRVRLELAADWLVMAAWLTWLKSRLLVPSLGEAEDAEPSCWPRGWSICRWCAPPRPGWDGARNSAGTCFPAVRRRILPKPIDHGCGST